MDKNKVLSDFDALVDTDRNLFSSLETRCLTNHHRSSVWKIFNRHSNQQSFIAKYHKNTKQITKEFQILKYLYSQFQNTATTFVPKPLGYSTELGVIVMENVNGVSISKLLNKFPYLNNNTAIVLRAIDKTSKWLKFFQRLDYEPIRQNLVHHHKRVEIMERNLNVTLEYQKNNILLTRIAERLTDVRQNWPKTAPVLCHKDLTPWNVFVKDKDIFVIDYEATCICDPEYDIAWFSTRLVLSYILNSKKLQSTYYSHFINEFADKFNKDRFFFWRTMLLIWTYKRVQKERVALKSKIVQRWKLKTLESELEKSLLDIY